MDKITREIFRAWNWPTDHLKNFSQRPTPYRISKIARLNLNSVYRKWNYLFSHGDVEKVFLLPSDSLVQRHGVLITGVSNGNIQKFVSAMDNAYFLEMVHSGHVYEATGKMEMFKNTGTIAFLEFIDSSYEVVQKQARLLLEFVNSDIVTMPLPDVHIPPTGLNEKLQSVARSIAYSNLYDASVKGIASKFGVSSKTASRWIESILDKRALSAWPLLNQSVIRDFNTFIFTVRSSNEINASSLLRRAMNLELVSQRYLLYRLINGSLSLLMYYDSTGELDRCVDEFSSVFSDFVVITRFKTHLNRQVYVRNSSIPGVNG